MTHRPATAAEVRKHYIENGHSVRITRETQHVTYRINGDGPWLEGGYVKMYVMDDENGVTLIY